MSKQAVKYMIIRKNVKNINLRVKPSLEVIVSANHQVSEHEINTFVQSKSSWIFKHLNRFREVQSNEKETTLSNGTYLSYLGEYYELIIKKSPKNEMKFDKNIFYMYVTDPSDYTLKKEIYYQWLSEKSKIVFKEVLDSMYKLISVYNVNYPKMTVRKMKTRWGSCNPVKCKININLYLIKEKRSSVEYVILHELVHLIHANHSKEFYNSLEKLMPDHMERKNTIKNKVIKVL